jgi:beta-mannosidase
VASLRAAGDDQVSLQAHYFVQHLPGQATADVGLTANATQSSDGCLELSVSATGFVHALAIDVPGFIADDSYFHLSPGQTRSCRLAPRVPGSKPRGYVHALNSHAPVRINVSAPAPAP